MSTIKAPKKVSPEKKTKTESTTKKADTSSVNKTETSAVDKAETSTVDKTDAATIDKSVNAVEPSPKSASQSSISHFSSVSTPEYRAGWERIFGGTETKKKLKPESEVSNSQQFPTRIEIQDADIDAELRTTLYKAFLTEARKQGVSFDKDGNTIEYRLNCNIRKET
jgi:hypothetical protein